MAARVWSGDQQAPGHADGRYDVGGRARSARFDLPPRCNRKRRRSFRAIAAGYRTAASAGLRGSWSMINTNRRILMAQLGNWEWSRRCWSTERRRWYPVRAKRSSIWMARICMPEMDGVQLAGVRIRLRGIRARAAAHHADIGRRPGAAPRSRAAPRGGVPGQADQTARPVFDAIVDGRRAGLPGMPVSRLDAGMASDVRSGCFWRKTTTNQKVAQILKRRLPRADIAANGLGGKVLKALEPGSMMSSRLCGYRCRSWMARDHPPDRPAAVAAAAAHHR